MAQGTLVIHRREIKAFQIQVGTAMNKNITLAKVICEQGR
jgi:hypothetical protein